MVPLSPSVKSTRIGVMTIIPWQLGNNGKPHGIGPKREKTTSSKGKMPLSRRFEVDQSD